jgi:glycosyltransferase involved in cell wall biosynthesis
VNEFNFKLLIAGYDAESHYINKQGEKVNHWDETGKLFNKKQFIHTQPIDSYMNIYQGKGICLIPLENTPFNACKSNLKMLEAGWAKKPVIASGVHPYTTIGKDRKNCLFAYTHKAWVQSISYMLENPNFADDMRIELHEDVKNNYLLENVNQTRINLIEK